MIAAAIKTLSLPSKVMRAIILASYLVIPLLCSACFSSSTADVMQSGFARVISPFTSVDNDTDIHELRLDSENGATRVFTTTLEACPVQNTRSLQATTRQLLIGFDKLTVLESGRLASRTRVSRTLASASIDEQPVKILIYSLRDDDCVTDYIAWYLHDGSEHLNEHESEAALEAAHAEHAAHLYEIERLMEAQLNSADDRTTADLVNSGVQSS